MDSVAVELRLEFLRKLDYLHLTTSVSRLICETIKNVRLPTHFVDEVELAVSEACTNAVKHSSDIEAHASSKVGIVFRVFETKLVIEVRDRGKGFRLDEVPLPEFDQHPERGYGVYIIQRMMDEVQYTQNDDYNTLTMTKYIANRGETL